MSPYSEIFNLDQATHCRLVTSSYEVLSDSQKRQIYDTRGEAGLSESGGMGGMDPQVRFFFGFVSHTFPPYLSNPYRISSVNSSAVQVVSSVAVVAAHKALVKQKILYTAYTSL